MKTVSNTNSVKKSMRLFIKLFLKQNLVKGGNIKILEKKLAKYVGVKNAILTSSARYALYLILKSLKIERGKDEILLPSFMPPIVAIVAVICGLKPVFVDIDKKTYNIDPSDIEKKITKNTKILLIVHLYGIPCDMDRIMKIVEEHDLFLIEDTAQAFGAEYNGKKAGSFGYASIISFGILKNINTDGGGLILTDNSKINKSIRKEIKKLPYPSPLKLLKNLLKTKFLKLNQNKYFYKYVSFSILRSLLFLRITNIDRLATVGFSGTKFFKRISKISEKKFIQKYGHQYSNFQAKLGLIQLESYGMLLEKQNRNAEKIKASQNIFLPSYKSPAYFLCCISLDNRKLFSEYMFKSGISVGYAHYPVLPDMEIFEKYKCACPNARNVSNNIVYIPFKAHLGEKDILKILHLIGNYNKYFTKKSYFSAYGTNITNLKP